MKIQGFQGLLGFPVFADHLDSMQIKLLPRKDI